jgi:pimeloyl-ACP methyl ester carboxylesterase
MERHETDLDLTQSPVAVLEQPTTGDAHTVRGGGGLQLHVREWGNPNGPPILFIHGWSQNHLCWTKQVGGPLAQEFRLVALDNRGHGMSDKPLEAEHYTDPQRWADDIAAVIEALRLDRPVLVGWSYGGLIMCDYLRAHGQARVAGINFVGGAVALGEHRPGRRCARARSGAMSWRALLGAVLVRSSRCPGSGRSRAPGSLTNSAAHATH